MREKSSRERMRTITIPPVGLEGQLGLPIGAKGIVLFAHGSGSGRLSPRNNFVAQALRDDGLATLLFDLLTVDKARDRRNVFDIQLLAQRLLIATAWVRQDVETHDLAVGYFGASTGAAAALVAEAAHEWPIAAIARCLRSIAPRSPSSVAQSSSSSCPAPLTSSKSRERSRRSSSTRVAGS